MEIFARRSGFTLIELIVTVGIVAVLITIVTVSLNPAEQLARARDAKRTGDLASLRKALDLYMAQSTGANLTGETVANDSCVGGSSPTLFSNTMKALGPPSGFTAVTASNGQTVATSSPASTTISWLPALIGSTPGGSPLTQLPLDPKSSPVAESSPLVRTAFATTPGYLYLYAYACRKDSTTYEMTARFESDYYKDQIDADGTDGGNSTSTYEVGTDLTIIPKGL